MLEATWFLVLLGFFSGELGKKETAELWLSVWLKVSVFEGFSVNLSGKKLYDHSFAASGDFRLKLSYMFCFFYSFLISETI